MEEYEVIHLSIEKTVASSLWYMYLVVIWFYFESILSTIRFEIQKYTKGTEDRGYILKGIDDITTLYDDNSMSLQTMSASRYVSPFLSTVQKWEKTLSLIAEVTEVWMFVQRYGMENLFIGSRNI